MRNTFLIILVIIASYGFSQSTYDSRLADVFTTEYLHDLSQDKINVLTFELDHSYFILDNFEKNETLPELYRRNVQTKEVYEQALTNVDFNNFNVLNYSYEKKYNNRNYYKIGNTGKTIVFYSIKEFTESYNLTK